MAVTRDIAPRHTGLDLSPVGGPRLSRCVSALLANGASFRRLGFFRTFRAP